MVQISDITRLYDTHMHSKWSGDCEVEPAAMIASARAKGLAGITFTDHLDWDFPSVPHMFDLDLANYIPQMKRMADEESDEALSIRVGIELGLQRHIADRHSQLLSSVDFDFVIGSIHQIDGIDPYYQSYFEDKSFQEAYQKFFEVTLENLEAFSDIDSLGHLDYISRYGQKYAQMTGRPMSDGFLKYDDFAEVIDAILLFLISHDIALEVNTAPYRHRFPEPNPSREILKRYHDLGGTMITIGADAHTPQDIAIGFDSLPALLHLCGFDSFFLFEHRNPVEVLL